MYVSNTAQKAVLLAASCNRHGRCQSLPVILQICGKTNILCTRWAYVCTRSLKSLLQEWTPLVDTPKTEWMESVQLVFDYFCERTPRSFVEARETSVVWNYKYADNEFGRLQVRLLRVKAVVLRVVNSALSPWLDMLSSWCSL